MKIIRKNVILFLFILFALVYLGDCGEQTRNQSNGMMLFTAYRDIPGVTSEEIAAIEALRGQNEYFVYGMPLSVEAFNNENGEIRGFSAVLCEWLTELFGIPFKPEIFKWQELLSGLENGRISFSGELTITDERSQIYNMTGALISRPVKYFRLADNRYPVEITNERRIRCGFINGAATINVVLPELPQGTYDVVLLDDFSYVYDALVNGEIDAFYSSGSAEVNFIQYSDVITNNFYPLLRMPVSLATQNDELKPIISVIDKALQNNATRYLTEMYNQSYQEYTKYKLFSQFSGEELAYINSKPVILFSAEHDNYPASFFDTRINQWMGIGIDMLREIEALTGLKFLISHDHNTDYPSLIKMLDNGESSFHIELVRFEEQENKYLWPVSSYNIDFPALISKMEHRSINIHEIYSVRVGLTKNSTHTEMFHKWFPNHYLVTEYEGQNETFDALMRGDVDMVMNSYSGLLYLTHYLERPGYKINYMFDYPYFCTFGFNKDQKILCSIIDKTLGIIDRQSITNQWLTKTYDFRSKLAEAQIPWSIGTSILFFGVLALVAVMFIRNRIASRELEKLITTRTDELALQTATLSTLFDSIPDLIFTKDKELNFIHCNKSLLEHFGLMKEDVIGNKNINNAWMSFELSENNIDIENKVINEGRQYVVEEHIPRIDGLSPLFETIKIPLILHGEAIGVLGIARDITKRKEMEQKMLFNYEYSKKLSDALAKITKSPTISAGVIQDAASVVAQIGCAALNVHRVGIWRYSEPVNALESIAFFDVFSGENTHQENYCLNHRQEYIKLLKSERVIVMNTIDECMLVSTAFNEYDHLCAAIDAPVRVDGKLAGVVSVEQWRCEAYVDKRDWLIEEQSFVSSLADLMALAISGSERRKAREAAETANQTKSSFLANMSHEIRTPMNAILGVTEILIQNETLSNEVEEGLGRIYSSCDLLLGIINDILDFSKIEAGKMDIMPAQYKVASMINDSVQLNMMRIESKPIAFELKVDENVPAKLIGDELRIKQILNNLLSNAFKYTDAGKVTMSVGYEVISLINYLPDHSINGQVRWLFPDKEGVTLVLKVQDTGHGMSKDELDKIFDDYSRFNREKNATVEGTGLGLAITQRLVNLMGGVMHVDSEEGSGSCFIVRLPQETVDIDVLGKEVTANLKKFRMIYLEQKKRSQLVREMMPYGKILIVDDVETNLYVAVGLMKLYKLQIDTAMSGQEAIDKVKSGKEYDIIFMDHMMPEMDGIEALNHLRDLGYKAPIVALTANAVAGQSDVFIEKGFDDFISKPIDIRQLDSILNKRIRDKQPPDVIEAVRKKNEEMKAAGTEASQVDSLLLESFIRDVRKTLLLLEEMCINNEYDTPETKWYEQDDTLRKFTIIVHGIKSSLWNIGEIELSELAYKLEIGGREHNAHLVQSSAPGFINQLRGLLEKTEAEHNEQRNSGGEEEDEESLRNKFSEICDRAVDYDRKGALEIISGIKKCDNETQDIIEKVKSFVIHSDFEEAIKLASAHLRALGGSLLHDKKIEGLDIDRGLQRYGNDDKTYLRVLRSYAASVRSMLGVVENASEDKLNDYKIKVHGIKGTSLDIFAEEVGSAAKDLEEAAKTGNFDYIVKHNPAFLEAAGKMVSDIEDLLAKIEAENPKPEKDRPDADTLAKLLDACKNFDMDGIDAAMSLIEKFKYISDDGLADWLRDNVDRMNIKQIVEKISNME